MDTGLKDKVVFVTGASGGIGAAVAQQFAGEGARLVLHGHGGRDRLSLLAARLPGEPLTVTGDVGVEEQVEEMFAAVTEPEIAIRAWAQQDHMVHSFVERVDSVRRDFLLKVFRSVEVDDEQVRLMVDMLSTMLVGSITILPRLSPERVMDLYREFKRLYRL